MGVTALNIPDGIIRDAEIVEIANGFVIRGKIFRDQKNRFINGEVIRTSLVLGIKNGIVTTRNSTYMIEGISYARED